MFKARVQQKDFSSMGTQNLDIQCIGWLLGSGLHVTVYNKMS